MNPQLTVQKSKQKKMARSLNLGTHLLFIVFAIFCVLPVLLLIATSFTPQEELAAEGVKLIPKGFSLEAWKLVFKTPQMIFDAYKVSIFVTVVGTILNLLMCALTAYPLSKPEYKFASQTSFFIYFTVLFSGGIVPFYILCTQILHLKDSIWVLILPLLASPWIIFLLRTFFGYVPRALLESAKIDGAGEYRVFFSILLPLSMPALATAGLMIALIYWNDWYHAMLFVEKQNVTPVQMMLQNLTSYIDLLRENQSRGMSVSMGEIPSDGIVAATCLVAVGPMLCVFLFFQKYFISGITVGAVKE